MHMKDLEIRFRKVFDKFQQLLKNHQVLQRENEKLRNAIAALKKEQEDMREAAEKIKLERDVLKMSAGSLDDKEKKELDRQLSRYIKEIDKCIAQLS